MSLVKNKDNRTGITYVYESESYWDKEKKQPRSRRKLIGKLDEKTGEIIPTDGRGRKRKVTQKECPDNSEQQKKLISESAIVEKDQMIQALKEEIAALKNERAAIRKQLQKIIESISG